VPLLVVLLIGVPLVEIWALVQVAQLTGWGTALVLLLVISIIGAVLLKREGAKAWRAFTAALAEGRIPAAEVVDGALVIVGGALMLTPGFVTDAVGLLCVLPPSRRLVNRALRRQVRAMAGLGGLTLRAGGPRRPRPADEQPVIDVEVLDIRRDEPGER
jgi:UPF0716 protein FxsA